MHTSLASVPRSLLLASLVALLAVGGFFASRSLAAAGDMPLTGWAWSQYMGWISFSGTADNGAEYGVFEDTATGALSGYAWSSNLGWISFEASDAGHPAPAADLESTGALSGWARACAAFVDKESCSGPLDVNSAGWDGWIALSGVADDGGEYGIVQDSSCKWSGYGWGSDAIGAISASGTAADGSPYGVTGDDPDVCAIEPICPNGANDYPACESFDPCSDGALNPPSCDVFLPTASLDAYPATVDLGGSSMLTWDSEDATSCEGTGFTAGGPSGSRSTGPLDTIGDSTFQVVCTGPTGDSQPAFATVEVLDASVTISADPSRVRIGDPTPITISWKAADVKNGSCNVSGPGLSLTGLSATEGASETVSSINSQSTYTISCRKKAGNTPISSSVTVNILPIFQEF